MNIEIQDTGSIFFDQVEDILFEIFLAIREPVESGDSRVESRLFPAPSEDNLETDLIDDWKSLVEPDLHDHFLAARETTAADLRNARKNPNGTWQFTIPRSHIENWLSALNQARLALAEIHHFTDADLNRPPVDFDEDREVALMKMTIYGNLQEWLISLI